MKSKFSLFWCIDCEKYQAGICKGDSKVNNQSKTPECFTNETFEEIDNNENI